MFFGKCENCGGQTKWRFKSLAKRFCSRKCGSVKGHFSQGHSPWNKGKPHMRGKDHPMFGSHRMGEEAAHWKGGRIKHQRGYVLIYCPDHPHRTKQGYVFEHRLVMEKNLGRYLSPEEVVHHKNKILEDNRIENLGLFSSQEKHLNYHKAEREVSLV